VIPRDSVTSLSTFGFDSFNSAYTYVTFYLLCLVHGFRTTVTKDIYVILLFQCFINFALYYFCTVQQLLGVWNNYHQIIRDFIHFVYYIQPFRDSIVFIPLYILHGPLLMIRLSSVDRFSLYKRSEYADERRILQRRGP